VALAVTAQVDVHLNGSVSGHLPAGCWRLQFSDQRSRRCRVSRASRAPPSSDAGEIRGRDPLQSRRGAPWIGGGARRAIGGAVQVTSSRVPDIRDRSVIDALKHKCQAAVMAHNFTRPGALAARYARDTSARDGGPRGVGDGEEAARPQRFSALLRVEPQRQIARLLLGRRNGARLECEHRARGRQAAGARQPGVRSTCKRSLFKVM